MLVNGSMPSITPAQLGALLTFVIGQAVAFGLVDKTREQNIIAIGSAVLAVVWKIVDAYLRAERAKAVAANPAAFPGTPVSPPPPPSH